MANNPVMPEGHLHAVVDAIASAGSQQLARRAAEGAPVPFDLVEVPSSGSGAPLFSYRPRTRDFVEEHAGSLRQLMAWSTAVNVLAGFDGLGDYLLTHGERHVPIDARERADTVLRVLLARMHEETGDFLHTPARSAEAADSLARCLLAGRIEGTVVVPLLGVRLDEERIVIEDGLELVRDDVIVDLPREARSPVRTRSGTLVVVRSLEDPVRAAALAQARPRLRALLTALRLYDQPSPALAPVAWSRVRGDGWTSHPFIGTCARASGTLHIRPGDEAAIRGFCALMADRAPTHGPAAWALRRFELACERAEHGEALTDVLLGLRALLEADHVGSGTLADRLAALCAAPGEWDALRDRVQIAESLEMALMQGTTTDASRTRALSLEMRGHLRALLRDMACGHLPADLVEIAEQHLIQDGSVPRAAAPEAEPAPQGSAEDLRFDVHPVLITDVRADEVGPGWPQAHADGPHPQPAEPGQVVTATQRAHPATDPAAPHAHPVPKQAPTMQPEPEPEPLRPIDPLSFAPAQPRVPEPQRSPDSTNAFASPHVGPRLVQPPAPLRQGPTLAGHGPLDPRAMTSTGEAFEDAFVRSLRDGPSTLR